jgi:hypothetical protein
MRQALPSFSRVIDPLHAGLRARGWLNTAKPHDIRWLILSFCVSLILSACASARFQSGPATPSPTRPAPSYEAPEPAIEPLPSSPVQSAPLSAPLAAPIQSAPVQPSIATPNVPAIDPLTNSLPSTPDVPKTRPMTPAPNLASVSQQGVIAPLSPPDPAVALAPNRNQVLGGWTARDATGNACRVLLSSTPSLDLYKASASSCTNRDLSKVTAWDFRDGEVYLYQPGGAITARMRVSGGAMDGVLSKSGAPLKMAR